jgi:hypothetical protein
MREGEETGLLCPFVTATSSNACNLRREHRVLGP